MKPHSYLAILIVELLGYFYHNYKEDSELTVERIRNPHEKLKR